MKSWILMVLQMTKEQWWDVDMMTTHVPHHKTAYDQLEASGQLPDYNLWAFGKNVQLQSTSRPEPWEWSFCIIAIPATSWTWLFEFYMPKNWYLNCVGYGQPDITFLFSVRGPASWFVSIVFTIILYISIICRLPIFFGFWISSTSFRQGCSQATPQIPPGCW